MGPIPDMGHLDALEALQNRVAKKFAKFIHLSWNLSWGSLEVFANFLHLIVDQSRGTFPKRYNT